jgi:hypothetical protein
MPKFAPNTGFKMPGVGSKNIDSPGNFRDEQHVDKVGYCDTTEDSMLPEGSSPLKVRYTTSGYRKDLKEVDLNLRKKKEGCPEGYVKKGEECVKLPEKKKQPEVKKPVDEKPEVKTTDNNKRLPSKEELNEAFRKVDTSNLNKKQDKGPKGSITVKTPGTSMRKAYDDALVKGYREEKETFEDYSKRAKKDKNYGKGGTRTITGYELEG